MTDKNVFKRLKNRRKNKLGNLGQTKKRKDMTRVTKDFFHNLKGDS